MIKHHAFGLLKDLYSRSLSCVAAQTSLFFLGAASSCGCSNITGECIFLPLPFQRQAAELSALALLDGGRDELQRGGVHLLAAGLVGDAQVRRPAALRRRRPRVLGQHRDGAPQQGKENTQYLFMFDPLPIYSKVYRKS